MNNRTIRTPPNYTVDKKTGQTHVTGVREGIIRALPTSKTS